MVSAGISELQGQQQVAVERQGPKVVTPEVYPWIGSDGEVDIVRVTLNDGIVFDYGSLVGLNSAATKIASGVPKSDSESAQSVLFQGLPAVLNGDRQQGIAKVENSRPGLPMLFSASRNITKGVRMLFTIDSQPQKDEPRTVYKVGISLPKYHSRLLKVIGVVQSSRHHYR